MTSLTNDPQLQLAFSLYESKGVFAVLIGSGLSRAAEIPTGWEITLDLIRRVGLAQGVEEQADWATWYRDKSLFGVFLACAQPRKPAAYVVAAPCRSTATSRRRA